MRQEDKDLLLKDLCGRLPYKVKCEVIKRQVNGEMVYIRNGQSALELTVNNIKEIVTNSMYEIRPYLFPLSSISEELKNFIRWKLTTPKYDSFDEESLEDLLNNNRQVVHFCYEHHLDINGFIEKGLAINATGLNIY